MPEKIDFYIYQRKFFIVIIYFLYKIFDPLLFAVLFALYSDSLDSEPIPIIPSIPNLTVEPDSSPSANLLRNFWQDLIKINYI